MGKESTVVTEIKLGGAELNVTEEVAKRFDAAVSSEDIRRIIEEEAVKQHIVIPGKTQVAPAAATPAAKTERPVIAPEKDKSKESDDFVIGGKSYHFEGDSPADISRQVKAALTAHENATKPAPAPSKDEAAEVKVKEQEALTLQLDFAAGRISIDEYVLKSGAVEKYLESKGVKTEDLKDIVDEKKSDKFVEAWESATAEFLKLEGNDWPGGINNQKVMGYKLAELGLSDSPSVESFQKAYDAMKAEGLVFTVQAPEKVAPVPTVKKKATSSSTFGVGGSVGRDQKAQGTQPTVPAITADMSPRDIMEAYKAAALSQGIHPDELMREAQGR